MKGQYFNLITEGKNNQMSGKSLAKDFEWTWLWFCSKSQIW